MPVHARFDPLAGHSFALHFWHIDQRDLPDLGTLKASAEKFGLDLNKPLDQRMAKLDALNVTFHAKLGSQGDRVARIRALAAKLAPIVGADPAEVDRRDLRLRPRPRRVLPRGRR